MSRRLQVALAGVAAGVVVAAAAVAVTTGGGDDGAAPARPAAAARSADATGTAGLRTVLVVDSARPTPRTRTVAARDCISRPTSCSNGDGGVELVYSVGPVARAGVATVLTDDNCEPDQHGISHCLNELRYEDGTVATVRHDHSMATDACLSPGERVIVARA